MNERQILQRLALIEVDHPDRSKQIERARSEVRTLGHVRTKTAESLGCQTILWSPYHGFAAPRGVTVTPLHYLNCEDIIAPSGVRRES